MPINKKSKVILLMFTVAVIILVTAFSYAFFTTNVNNDNSQKISLKSGSMKLSFLDNDNGVNAKLSLGQTVEKKFIIKNEGTLESSLSLDWDNLINTYTNGSLTYSLYYSESKDGELTEIYPESNIPTSTKQIKQTLCGEITVPAGQTYYYSLKITFNDLDINQNNDINAIFSTMFFANAPSSYRYYKLNIDATGGSFEDGATIQEKLLKHNETYKLETPTRENYTFVGWYLKGASSSITDDIFTMGITDTYLTAIWANKTYDLIVDYNTPNVENVTEKVAYQLPKYIKRPTRESYTFIGWETTDGSFDGDNFILNKAQATTIKAKWVHNYDYITNHKKMQIDGTTYEVADTEIGTGGLGLTVSPNIKTYKGFTSPQEKKKLTIQEDTNPPTKNIVDYEYTRNKYKVKFELNGGTSTTGEKYLAHYIDNSTGEDLFTRDYYGEAGTQPGIYAFHISGYTYIEARVRESTKEFFLYYEPDSTYNPTINLTIAFYDLETNELLLEMPYSVKEEVYESDIYRHLPANYSFSGGYLVEEESKYYAYCEKKPDFMISTATEKDVFYGSIVDLSHLTLDKPGYHLKSLTADNTNMDSYRFLMEDKDVTITANWQEAKYAVQFISNGGYFDNNPSKTVSTKIVTYNGTYGDLPIPTYPGYTFNGWYTENGSGTLITKESLVQITEYQTLYASWIPKENTVLDATLAKLNITDENVFKDAPDFSKIATDDAGIYMLGDDYGMSYYYRGNVNNNYVLFGNLTKLYIGIDSDNNNIPVGTEAECLNSSKFKECGYIENYPMYWRIIRVNGDGSLRLMYDGIEASANGSASLYRNLFYSSWNDNSDDNKYVGYMYGGANGVASTTRINAQKNETNSQIKTGLDSFYETNLAKYEQYLGDELFCNNRITFSNGFSKGYGINSTYYSMSRLGAEGAKPEFRCYQKSDAFTVSDTVHGNASLTHPIGLITADEAMAAGANTQEENNKYYLYKGYGMWTMSPAVYVEGTGAAMYGLGTTLSSYLTNSFVGVAPVINLKAEYVNNLMGSGTVSEPYYIESVNPTE